MMHGQKDIKLGKAFFD